MFIINLIVFDMISQNDLARYQEMGFTPQMVYNAARIAQ